MTRAAEPPVDASTPTYERIYAVVRQIPPGKVAAYGQIASIVGGCTARRVGYAMAALTSRHEDVPWHRVINAQGKISLRADSAGAALQHRLLEEEGVRFDASGKVDFRQVRWSGPPLDWLLEHGYNPEPSWRDD